MLMKTFKEMLFVPEAECLKELPSPEELKYRIIISTKPPKEYLEDKSVNDKADNLHKRKDSEEDSWGKEPSDLTDEHEDVDAVSLRNELTTC
jgi:phosphatidylinositol phospholipase C delta